MIHNIQYIYMQQEGSQFTDQMVVFTQRAENYHIELKLTNKELKINLIDLQEGVIYQQSFDSEYFRKIKTFLDSIEVFYIFSNETQFNDASNQKKKKTKSTINTNHRIGDFIQKKNGSYSVQKGGKVQVTFHMIYPSTKKICPQKITLELKEIKKIQESDKIDIKLRGLQERLEQKFEQKLELLQRDYEQKLNKRKELYIKDQKTHHWRFILCDNIITYIGDGNWIQLLFNESILMDQAISFRIKIKHTPNKGIMFGVLNKKVRMHERTSYNVNSDAVAYYAYDGNVYGVGNKQGNGFTTNDVVTMKVNLKEGVVQWSVNAVNKASANCQMLKNINKQFVPFIEMCNDKDCVQWLGKVPE